MVFYLLCLTASTFSLRLVPIKICFKFSRANSVDVYELLNVEVLMLELVKFLCLINIYF